MYKHNPDWNEYCSFGEAELEAFLLFYLFYKVRTLVGGVGTDMVMTGCARGHGSSRRGASGSSMYSATPSSSVALIVVSTGICACRCRILRT